MARRPRDREWWRLLGCGLPWIPVLWLTAALFLLLVPFIRLPREAPRA